MRKLTGESESSGGKIRGIFEKVKRKGGALAVGAIATSSACMPSTPWQGPEDGRNVGVAGDSLTFSSNEGPGIYDGKIPKSLIVDELTAKDFRVSVAARIGARTTDLASVSWKDEEVDISVIALGTNDGARDSQTGERRVAQPLYEENFEAYMDQVQADCDVIVGVKEEPSWGLDESGPVINNYLRYQASARSGVFVNWDSFAQTNPGFFGPDGIHFAGTTGLEAGFAGYRRAMTVGAGICDAMLDHPEVRQFVELTPDNIDDIEQALQDAA